MTPIVPQYLNFTIHNVLQNLDAIACVYTLVEIISHKKCTDGQTDTHHYIYCDFSSVVVFEDCVLDFINM